MPTSLYQTLAQGINDAGEITGSEIDTATTPQTVGFLAVPVFDGSGNPDIAAKAKAQANPRQVPNPQPCRTDSISVRPLNVTRIEVPSNSDCFRPGKRS
jgi:hypothetical protein